MIEKVEGSGAGWARENKRKEVLPFYCYEWRNIKRIPQVI